MVDQLSCLKLAITDTLSSIDLFGLITQTKKNYKKKLHPEM